MQNQIKHQEAIFQALPDLFFIILENGTILEYKTAVEAHPLQQEIVGKRIQDIMPEEIALKFNDAIRDLQKTKSIVHIDYPLTIQKQLHFYEARLVPLLETQIIINIQNITARKTVEQKLIKAKEDAEKANRSTNELLAQMSQELCSPLNGIVRYSQIIQKDKKLTELQLSAIYVIERSCNYLLKLSKDMLEFSNVEAKKEAIPQSSINLPKFLTDISELVRIQAQKKGVSFRYETTSDLPQAIYIDEKSLAQILVKLLSNAIKFTEHGGVTLKVGYIEQKTHIRFRVSDNGIGIPPEQLEAIFSPFEQLDKHKQEGTGLGLSISQKRLRLMGSDLQVESKIGKGSLFWFDLAPKQALKQQLVIKPDFPSNLQMLYEFAKQGNCSGIARWLEKMGDKNTPFFQKVNQLAQEFQHEEICNLIESKRDKK